jgi:hypothetical protein
VPVSSEALRSKWTAFKSTVGPECEVRLFVVDVLELVHMPPSASDTSRSEDPAVDIFLRRMSTRPDAILSDYLRQCRSLRGSAELRRCVQVLPPSSGDLLAFKSDDWR